MAIFKYKAVNKEGKTIAGQFSAASKNEVLAMIRENHCFPTEIEEVYEKRKLIPTSVKSKDIGVFCRQLYTLLDAGVDMIHAIMVIKEQAENKRMKDALEKVFDDLQKGYSLSTALKKHPTVYPPLLNNMIYSGEQSGNLVEVIRRMSLHYEKEQKTINKIKTAMIYPIILSIVSILIVIFILTFVMPQFTKVYEGNGAELPAITKFVVSMGNVFSHYWHFVVLLIIALAYGVKLLSKTPWFGRVFESIKLTIPIIRKTYSNIVTARFARNMSTILSSGVSLIRALEIVTTILQNKTLSDQLRKCREEVMKGYLLGETLDLVPLFSPMLKSMVRVGEETGKLGEVLEKTADYYDEEVEHSVSKLTTLVEPILILVMAVIVGGIMIALVLPMFDIYNAY